MAERTFSIIKPDATRRNLTGAVTRMLEEGNDLVAFMTSGPVVVQVLEGENAVARNREIMGATNPANADEGTIRKVHAESIEANSVHGSDSDENAKIEIDFFFTPEEIVG
jgi:nucleoside-diphosphate kinase